MNSRSWPRRPPALDEIRYALGGESILDEHHARAGLVGCTIDEPYELRARDKRSVGTLSAIRSWQ